MKAIIVGAGLSGLSTAIALRRYVRLKNETLEIKIYDRADPHDTGSYGWNDHADLRLKNQGAAISLQSNALKVLRDLDAALADRVYANGFPCKGFTWKTGGDYLLGREYLDLLPISRPTLIQCLQEALPKDVAVEYKTVTKVDTNPKQKPVIHFGDGTTEYADLIVGSDGIRSPMRQGLFADNKSFHPQYLGHCAVGGILDKGTALPKTYLDDPTIMFFEGPNGFFGYCGLSQADPSKILYFSIYDSELPDRSNLNYKQVNEDLRERYKDFGDPVIRQCLDEATIDNIYPICWVPDLPSWGRDGCVLVGDAAHAMPPASGQGGSQAFEDGQTLALLLAGFLAKQDVDGAIERSIEGFYKIRHERVDTMKAKALSLKEPERPWSFAMTLLVYAALFVTMTFKYIFSFIERKDPIRSWDAKVEVKKYLAAQLPP